jgi:hypothetical protein
MVLHAWATRPPAVAVPCLTFCIAAMGKLHSDAPLNTARILLRLFYAVLEHQNEV